MQVRLLRSRFSVKLKHSVDDQLRVCLLAKWQNAHEHAALDFSIVAAGTLGPRTNNLPPPEKKSEDDIVASGLSNESLGSHGPRTEILCLKEGRGGRLSFREAFE